MKENENKEEWESTDRQKRKRKIIFLKLINGK